MSRSNTKHGGSSATSSAFPSRTASPSNAAVGRQGSVDARTIEDTIIAGDRIINTPGPSNHSEPNGDSAKVSAGPSAIIQIPQQDQTLPVPHSQEPRLLERSSAELQDSRAAISSLELPEELSNGALISERRDDKTPLITVDQYETTISQMRSDYESAELRRQEETHHYLERIDTLQAKLQYLTKEAAEIARKSANEAEAGSIEERLARKDEKIALLMEEGQKLSQTELKHVNTIKKLRARSTEDERRISLSRRRVEDLERMAQGAQERAKRAEAGEKEEAERVKALQRVANEIEKVTSECGSQNFIIADLRQQVAQAKASTEKDDATDYKSLFETERELTVGLRHEISNARKEKKLSDEIHQVHIRDIVEKNDHKGEKAKVVEQELRGELKVSRTILPNHTADFDLNCCRYSKVGWRVFALAPKKPLLGTLVMSRLNYSAK